jgi:hypothetical protein
MHELRDQRKHININKSREEQSRAQKRIQYRREEIRQKREERDERREKR